MGNAPIHSTSSTEGQDDVFADIRLDMPKTKEGGYIPLTSLTISEVATLLDSVCLSEFKVPFRKRLVNGNKLLKLIRNYPDPSNQLINEKFHYIFRYLRENFGLSVPKHMCRNKASRYKLKSPLDFVVKRFVLNMLQAGRSKEQITAAGVPFGDILKYAPNAPVKTLVRAGYSFNEFTAHGIKLSKSDLRGFAVADLLKNGLTIMQLIKECNFTLDELKAAGVTASEMVKAGVNRGNGFLLEDLIRVKAKPTDFRRAGFTPKELRDAGIQWKTIATLSFTADDYRNDGISADSLISNFASLKDVLNSGFTFDDIDVRALVQKHGYSPAQLLGEGASIDKLFSSGVNVQALYDAGVSIQQMLGSGIPRAAISAGLKQSERVLGDLLHNGYTYPELIKQQENPYSITDFGEAVPQVSR